DALNPFLKQRPDDTILQKVLLPTVQAIAELNHANAEKALQLLKSAEPYDAGSPGVHYLRATAYLHSSRPAEAIQEYQKVLALRTSRGPDPTIALAQLGLARAYLTQGEKAKARTAYQDLLAIWKDADSDLPLVQKAKAEYAKLQ
ncbi:MAG TPA: tetratricopeptide repeat protein, partial [Terracidiphilus sp.]|nr:tetratricopeptide repeat protein [Terracidiphilus sp.]